MILNYYIFNIVITNTNNNINNTKYNNNNNTEIKHYNRYLLSIYMS